jgi:thiamine-phosphate pyrophosphorylase
MEVPEPRLRIWRPEHVAQLPRLVLIADPFTIRSVAHATVDAVQAGVEWVHLRDDIAPNPVFWEVGRNLVGRLRRVNENVLISINSRAEFAEEWFCGVHTGSHGPPMDDIRKRSGLNGPVGYSAHSHDVARAALDSGSDYLFFSPIFETPLKPWAPPLGISGLNRICKTAPERRIYALGGVTPERVAACISAGARGVAAVSAILSSDNPAAEAARFLDAIEVAF